MLVIVIGDVMKLKERVDELEAIQTRLVGVLEEHTNQIKRILNILETMKL